MANVRAMEDGAWFWIGKSLLDKYGEAIGPYALSVYMVLARHANSDQQRSFPSYATIAKRTGMSRRQAMKAMEILEHLDLVYIEKTNSKKDTDDHASNRYYLLEVPDQTVEEIKKQVAECKPKEGYSAKQATTMWKLINRIAISSDFHECYKQEQKDEILNECWKLGIVVSDWQKLTTNYYKDPKKKNMIPINWGIVNPLNKIIEERKDKNFQSWDTSAISQLIGRIYFLALTSDEQVLWKSITTLTDQDSCLFTKEIKAQLQVLHDADVDITGLEKISAWWQLHADGGCKIPYDQLKTFLPLGAKNPPSPGEMIYLTTHPSSFSTELASEIDNMTKRFCPLIIMEKLAQWKNDNSRDLDKEDLTKLVEILESPGKPKQKLRRVNP